MMTGMNVTDKDVMRKEMKEDMMIAEKMDELSDIVLADFNTEVLVNLFKEKNALKKKLEEELAKIREAICIELADSEMLVNESGEVLATYRLSSPVTRFDKDRLALELPNIYEKYVYKGDPVRTFLVK